MTEKAIVNKMSLYDILTLIVPSALVCCAWDFPNVLLPEGWLGYVAKFGFVLLLGLALKSFGAWWGSCWFRNNTEIIREEEEKQVEGNYKFSACTFMHTWVCDPIRYIFSPGLKLCIPEEPDRSKLKEYYQQYEKAYNDSYYSKRIDILESHVAFLQTWAWALVACMLCHMKCINGKEFGMGLLVLGFYLSIVLMLAIQRKIYYLVWESRK